MNDARSEARADYESAKARGEVLGAQDWARRQEFVRSKRAVTTSKIRRPFLFRIGFFVRTPYGVFAEIWQESRFYS